MTTGRSTLLVGLSTVERLRAIRKCGKKLTEKQPLSRASRKCPSLNHEQSILVAAAVAEMAKR